MVYRVRLSELPDLVCSEESREMRFFSRGELRKVKVAATHIPIVEEYMEGWRGIRRDWGLSYGAEKSYRE